MQTTPLLPTNVPTSKPSSWNPTTCPARCRCYHERVGNVVDCIELGLIAVPTGIPGDAQILYLAENPYLIIPPGSLDRLTQLIVVSFKETNLVRLPPHIFDKLSKLEYINLSQNRLECCGVKDALAKIKWKDVGYGYCSHTNGTRYSLRDLTKGSTKGKE